jgi:hypothetical protein
VFDSDYAAGQHVQAKPFREGPSIFGAFAVVQMANKTND